MGFKKNLRSNFFLIGFRKTFGIHESSHLGFVLNFRRLSELEIAVVNRPELSQMRFLKKPQGESHSRKLSVLEVLMNF